MIKKMLENIESAAVSTVPQARVLIVDDETPHMTALCRTLETEGYSTRVQLPRVFHAVLSAAMSACRQRGGVGGKQRPKARERLWCADYSSRAVCQGRHRTTFSRVTATVLRAR